MSDKVKHISEWYVRPEIEIDDSKRHYNLGSSDLSMLLLGYSQCIHLFKKPQTFSSSSFLDKFKLSLSQALVHFYPLAGQLVTQSNKDEQCCSIYIDCHEGRGAKLIHVDAAHLFIEDVLLPNSDIPDIVQSLFEVGVKDLINYDGHTKPLLSVQVTEVADGVIIGICTNHCVADGTSVINFFNIWSEIFMASSSISTPVIGENRGMIKLPYTDPTDEFTHNATTTSHISYRERIFHFSHTSIALLKAKANAAEDGVRRSSTSSEISSFQALSAFMWRCITRARRLSPKATTTCGLVANLRARFDPPLSQDYFGNFLKPAKETAEVGELLANTLAWASLLLHHAVVSLKHKVCGESVVPRLLLPGLQSQGANPVLFGGSPRLDAYGAEFGLGRALAVHMGFRKKDGHVSAFPGAKGDGSVNLQVCLAPQTMSLLLSDEEFMSFASN